MRDEYLRKLELALSEYDKELREDILTEFEAHFNEAKANGLKDDEIIAGLGPVEDVVDSIRTTYDKAPTAREEVEGEKEPIEIQIGEYSDGVRREEPQREVKSTSTELGFLLDEVDTIVVDGNMDLYLVPGDNEGRWEFKPSKTFEIGLNLFKGFSFSQTETGNIEVETFGNTARFSLPKGSGTLRIEVTPSVRFVDINGKSGDLDMSGVNLTELNAKSISGDFHIRDSKVDRAILSTTSGDVNGRSFWGNLDLSSISGDVYIESHQGPELNAKSISGDMDINTTSPVIRVDTKSGDVDVDMGGPLEYAEIGAVSGDIDFRSTAKDYTATVSTVSGELDNDTNLPEQRIGWGKKTVGVGPGVVLINTVSGDVYLG